MCPRCEGMGTRERHRPDPALRREQVARRGRDQRPRLHRGRLVDADVQRVRLLRPGQADPRLHRDGAPRLPLQGARQGQDQRHQPDLRGPRPEDPEVDAVQGRRRAPAAHPGVRGAGGHVQRVPRLRRHPAQRGGSIVEDRRDQHRRRLRDADQRPGRVGPRPRRAVGGAAAGGARREPRLVRRDGAGLPQPRPAVRHAVGRRGAAHEDDPPPRVVADRRHLRLRRADDRAARPRRRADERAAPSACATRATRSSSSSTTRR